MKPSFKAQLAAAIAAAPKRSVQIGGQLHVHVGSDTFGALDAKIAAALRRGDTVTENGESVWIEAEPVYDRTKSGSAAYTWKGERVKIELTRHTRKADGSVTRTPAGFAWRIFS